MQKKQIKMGNNKKNKKVKQITVLTREETARRKAQSERDKMMNASRVVTVGQAKRKKSKTVHPQVKKIQESYNTHQVSLNRLAMSMAAPQFTSPMRLPTVTRVKTDVKRLYVAGTLDPVGLVSDGYIGSSVGQIGMFSTLANNQAMFILTRDPLVPGYASKFFSFAPGQGFGVKWRMLSTDPTPGGVSFYDPTSTWSPPMLMHPITLTVTNDRDNVNINARLQPIMGLTDAKNNATSIGNDFYPLCHDERFYMWHPMGGFNIAARLVTGTGADLTVNWTWSLGLEVVKFNGFDEIIQEDLDWTITSTTNLGTLTIQDINVPTGFYQIRVVNYRVQNLTGALLAIPAHYIQLSVESSWLNGTSGRMTANIILPMQNTDLAGAQYVLDSARVNASSLLITNTAAAIRKAGAVYGMRVLGEDNSFTTLSIDEIKNGSAAQGIGYRGPLEKGLYTFLEPAEEMSKLRDYVDKRPAIGSYSGAPILHCRSDYKSEHVVICEWPVETNANTGVSLMFRYDQHLEFSTNSQLATLGISAAKVQEFTDATIALAAGSYFFENPSHLAQLWSWIKNTGRDAIRAGLYAGARHFLEQSVTAAGMFM